MNRKQLAAMHMKRLGTYSYLKTSQTPLPNILYSQSKSKPYKHYTTREGHIAHRDWQIETNFLQNEAAKRWRNPEFTTKFDKLKNSKNCTWQKEKKLIDEYSSPEERAIKNKRGLRF
jgi:hypothetical protein